MIRIGVCEDESIWRDHIEEVMNKFFINREEILQLKLYSKGESLLCDYERFDLIFLDIEMPGIDGIETAKRIRKIDSKVEIVFLTSHLEIMQEAFQVKAYRFLDKDFKYESIEKCLGKFMKDRKVFADIKINVGGKDIKINSQDIIMLEATKNGSIIHSRSNEFFCRRTLNEWEENLNNNLFFRTHKSYMVNLGCVKKIDKRIKLTKKCEAGISRRRRKLLEVKLFNFMEEFAR